MDVACGSGMCMQLSQETARGPTAPMASYRDVQCGPATPMASYKDVQCRPATLIASLQFSLVRHSSCRAAGGHGCRSHGLYRGQRRQDRGIDHESRYRNHLRCCVAQHGCRRAAAAPAAACPASASSCCRVQGTGSWRKAESAPARAWLRLIVNCRLSFVLDFIFLLILDSKLQTLSSKTNGWIRHCLV